MTVNNCISVRLTSEIRIEQALKDAGVKKPASVRKLAISGEITEADFRYIRKKMAKTLQELDMGDASVENNVLDGVPFGGCSGLTSITIPKTVEEIVLFATARTIMPPPDVNVDKNETSLVFNEDKTLIYCTRQFSNPDESITYSAFSGCTALTSINVHPDHHVFASEDGILFNKEKSMLKFYPRGRHGDYNIPDSVVKICDYVFAGCFGLTDITIPNSVVEIGERVFEFCRALTNVDLPNSVVEIGNMAFTNCDCLSSVAIPTSVAKIGEYAFCGCTSLTSVNIPTSITKIEAYTFCECSNLTTINIPAAVVEIGQGAFAKCTALTSVLIPNSVKTIRNQAFWGCTALRVVTIPDSLSTIEDAVFAHCTSLEIHIPVSVMKRIDNIKYCIGAKNLFVPNEPTKIKGKNYFILVANYL